MAKKASTSTQARSAVSGKFVKDATAKKRPKTTVVEEDTSKAGTKKSRSAVSGKFVKDATVKRHPKTTVAEGATAKATTKAKAKPAKSTKKKTAKS
jgi:hypothetical protein